ncbi:hypothetical protein LTS10_001474 [Elasticomyces elasticus]|nr:hypothetical protein LTS10_001474 [Elasticomyces elasticus]
MDLYNQIRHPRRLNDDERPNPVIWWLAGGRSRRGTPARGVPTGAVLRFLGTLAGAREVHKTRRQLREAAGRVLDAEKVKEDKPEDTVVDQAAAGNVTAADAKDPDPPADANAEEAAQQAEIDTAEGAP